MPHDQVVDRLPVLSEISPIHGYTPNFLTPPLPKGQQPHFARELARLRTSSPTAVEDGLKHAVAHARLKTSRGVLVRLVEDPQRAITVIADELALAWEMLVRPRWREIQALINADLAYRSAQVLQRGLGAAVNEVHWSVRWVGDQVHVSTGSPGTVSLEGHGLLFQPSAFGWPHVITLIDPWPARIAYPARGIAEMWSGPPRSSDALRRLLGPQRALVLAALAAPSTTTELAARLGLAPASVSRHLTIMNDSGLVSRRRVGHHVPYERTALGDALLRAEDPRDRGAAPSSDRREGR